MQRNLYKFSAAKDAAMLQEINIHLYDNKGNLKTFDEFRAALDSLNIRYNKNWLEAEYRTARQSGHMAQKWEAILANKALFPNLKYKTQEDDRVREEHAALNNIIAPIDHPFWQKYYPPNGWRCRCDAVQTAEEPSVNIPQNDPGIKPEFEINVGNSAQVFNENSKTGHRFFALAKDSPNWQKRFELSKLEAGFNTIKTPKGNKVKVSIYADQADLPVNLKRGVQMADELDMNVIIRPHIFITNWKNPEYQLNALIADLYQGDIKGGFRQKREQIKTFFEMYAKQFPDKKINGNYAIVFDVTKIKTFGYDVPRLINGKLKSGTKLQQVIIFNDDKMINISKNDDFQTIAEKWSIIAKEK